MKALLTASLLSLPWALQAQWTVYDPAVHNQIVAGTAQEVAKFVEMIQNQVKEIDRLQEQVQTLHHYVELFGNPAQVQISATVPLSLDLRKPESGQLMVEIQAQASGTKAMQYQGAGLYPKVGTQFTTVSGTVVARAETLYRPVAALQDATANFTTVSSDISARRTRLKAEGASLSEALKTASTDAEVQKLSVALNGVQTALLSLDQELHQAESAVLVQDAANRADETRQRTALQERRRAEFTEGVNGYSRAFRLQTSPAAFPIR